MPAEPPPSKLDVIFFDLDDTLYSTTEFATRARRWAVRAMIEKGLEAEEDEAVQGIARRGGLSAPHAMDPSHPEPIQEPLRRVLTPDAGMGRPRGGAPHAGRGELLAGQSVEEGGLPAPGGAGQGHDRPGGTVAETASGSADELPGGFDGLFREAPPGQVHGSLQRLEPLSELAPCGGSLRSDAHPWAPANSMSRSEAPVAPRAASTRWWKRSASSSRTAPTRVMRRRRASVARERTACSPKRAVRSA